MNEKVIYSKRLAFELRERGFKLLRTGINKNFPQYDTYIFQNSIELNKTIELLTNKNK